MFTGVVCKVVQPLSNKISNYNKQQDNKQMRRSGQQHNLWRGDNGAVKSMDVGGSWNLSGDGFHPFALDWSRFCMPLRLVWDVVFRCQWLVLSCFTAHYCRYDICVVLTESCMSFVVYAFFRWTFHMCAINNFEHQYWEMARKQVADAEHSVWLSA